MGSRIDGHPRAAWRRFRLAARTLARLGGQLSRPARVAGAALAALAIATLGGGAACDDVYPPGPISMEPIDPEYYGRIPRMPLARAPRADAGWEVPDARPADEPDAAGREDAAAPDAGLVEEDGGIEPDACPGHDGVPHDLAHEHELGLE